ncbi:hypothetical protein HBB16_06130 [Pseudonocardia sp. MCCB 268]|nr:hypothetical protein [Pseudonocardia cytotoxica]
MASGEIITDGPTRSPESLDLCLSCKGCKSDCPVGSTWPRTRLSSSRTATTAGCGRALHYSMGCCPAGCGSSGRCPRPPSTVSTGCPKAAAGEGREEGRRDRRPPRDPADRPGDPQSGCPRAGDVAGARPRRRAGQSGPRCGPTRSPTTSTRTCRADAVAVLTGLGYRAAAAAHRLLRADLDLDRRSPRPVLARSLRAIGPALDAGIPVVGLEPSCTAALRSDAAELPRTSTRCRCSPGRCRRSRSCSPGTPTSCPPPQARATAPRWCRSTATSTPSRQRAGPRGARGLGVTRPFDWLP